jgi:hypothetical protein
MENQTVVLKVGHLAAKLEFLKVCPTAAMKVVWMVER